jgi:hypothetical protein
VATVQKGDNVTPRVRLIAQAVDKDHGITCSWWWTIATSFERRRAALNKSHVEHRRHGQCVRTGILVGSFQRSGRGHRILTLRIHVVGKDIHRRPFEVHHLGRHPADGVVHHAVVFGNRLDLQHPLLRSDLLLLPGTMGRKKRSEGSRDLQTAVGHFWMF